MNKLNLGIMTYNGGATIHAAIDIIAEQISQQNLDVKLLISDNASIDDTFDICKNYSQKYPFIKIHRNEKNIGYDANICTLVNMADSEYLWLFSDDDVMTDPYAIKTVLDYLNKHNVEFLFLNHNNSIILDEKMPDYFHNGNEFFMNTRFKSGLVTSCIIKVDTWKDLNMERFINSAWIHFAYQVYALAPNRGKNCSAGIIKEVLIAPIPSDKVRVNADKNKNHSWGQGGTSLLIGLQLEEVIFSHLKELGYSDNVKELSLRVIYGYGLYFSKSIIYAKVAGLKIDKDLYLRLKKVWGHYPSFKYINKFLCLCPSLILKAMCMPWRIIRKIKAVMIS